MTAASTSSHVSSSLLVPLWLVLFLLVIPASTTTAAVAAFSPPRHRSSHQRAVVVPASSWSTTTMAGPSHNAFADPRRGGAPKPLSPSRPSSSSSHLCMNRKRPPSSSSKGFGAGGGSSSSSDTANAALVRPKTSPDFIYAGSIRPGMQTPMRTVPNDKGIKFPDYASDGLPKNRPALFPWVIEVKGADEIAKMRRAGRCAREVLDLAGRALAPGITTDEIDRIVHDATVSRGAYPSPLNYRNFPKSCCTSVNEVICHGIPDDRPLRAGDIINLDITCYLDGYHGDCSEMFVVGGEESADHNARKLIQATYDCWIKAMDFVRPGNDYKDIGGIIEDHVTELGFSTVKSFCGHGIGSVFHANPNILHYRNSEPAGRMASGHTFTIEPMICEGSGGYLMWPDDWTATTRDGGRSAQFEHTLLITPDGVEALTGKIETSPVQFWERDSVVHSGFWLGTSRAARERMVALNPSST